MLYTAYQTQADAMVPVRAVAEAGRKAWGAVARTAEASGPWWSGVGIVSRRMSAGCEMLTRAHLTHASPPFGIDATRVAGETVAVVEEIVASTPFASLRRFAKPGVAEQPRVLLVAPLSGHFATLLRPTVEAMLPDFDVYVTDWHNARDVPLHHGAFGLEDFTDHLISFLETIGAGAHLMAVCQPCVSALAATSVMAEAGSEFTPRSLTLMAGPVDTRILPNTVNRLAVATPLSWYRDNAIHTVPWRYAGAGRKVYPGFLQVTAFMAMNPRRHVEAHWQMFEDRAAGRHAEADHWADFYDEYFAVLDLAGEFYLETVNQVFQEHLLPRGLMEHRGRRLDPAAITSTALLTVEGDRDDICSVGQTMAAHELTPSIPPALRRHHLQPGVGHYGVFSGRRWRDEIYPVVRASIMSAELRGLNRRPSAARRRALSA